MSEFGEVGTVMLYRIAASGLLPVSWFRRRRPCRDPEGEAPGPASPRDRESLLALRPFPELPAQALLFTTAAPSWTSTVTVYYCPEDEPTLRVLRFFGDMKLPGITWNWRALPKEKLFRRGIGRNLAAKNTKAEWIWFPTPTSSSHEKCLDTLADLLQGRDDALVYPETTLGTALLPEHAPIPAQRPRGPALLALPQRAFPLRRGPADRARGPYQITHCDIARACGYCESIRLYQSPANQWRKCYEDTAFRWLIGTPGTPLDLPGVCQIATWRRGGTSRGRSARWFALSCARNRADDPGLRANESRRVRSHALRERRGRLCYAGSSQALLHEQLSCITMIAPADLQDYSAHRHPDRGRSGAEQDRLLRPLSHRAAARGRSRFPARRAAVADQNQERELSSESDSVPRFDAPRPCTDTCHVNLRSTAGQ